MIDISIDKSKTVRIKARVNEASVPQVLIFKNADGSAHDVTEYDFQVIVFKRENSSVRLFTLTVGDGLDITGAGLNQLRFAVTNSQARQVPDTYFWRMRSDAQDHTWLNGAWEFYSGESNALTDTDEIVINENGDPITIELTGISLTNSIGFNVRSDYDASGNMFPDTPTGSGPDGIIKRFDAYPISVGGYLDFGNGPEYVPEQSLLVAWANSPTDGTQWRLF